MAGQPKFHYFTLPLPLSGEDVRGQRYCQKMGKQEKNNEHYILYEPDHQGMKGTEVKGTEFSV